VGRSEFRIVSVVGARPQFIKLGMLDLALERLEDPSLLHLVIHTGQHYDANLSSVFFDELGLREPDENLGVGSGTHGEQTGRMVEALERSYDSLNPDLVLTYGDTNSTLAAALSAAKCHIPVAHIESGLRSGDKSMPEEVNRVLTDHVSAFLFCPTDTAVRNLATEGLGDPTLDPSLVPLSSDESAEWPSADAPLVLNVGDVMYDSVLHHARRATERGFANPMLAEMPKTYVLMTVHRAENTDEEARLRGILQAAAEITHRGTPVVFPIHPRTRAAIDRASLGSLASDLLLVDPISYYDMLLLERGSEVVLTDSGGVQREAFMLGRPCVTLRDGTEWVELLETGHSICAGSDPERILDAADRVLKAPVEVGMSPYGDGCAADRIAHVLWARRKRTIA